jgi:Fungal cellulose binding domain
VHSADAQHCFLCIADEQLSGHNYKDGCLQPPDPWANNVKKVCVKGMCVAKGEAGPSNGGGGGGDGTDKPLGRWKQCGGKHYKGPTKCKAGLTCKKKNANYSQCVPDKGTQGKKRAKLYEQCGGQGWKGPKKCNQPAKCVKVNQYYSQCRDK